ncbi:MAG: FecR domain-containing protein [Gammaproteobacteria bacterium]|nr:FecR domain-containing protein [Gammaproteobacteria bacterium]
MIGLLAAAASCASLAAVEVGEVTFARGVVTGQIDGEQPRIIGKGVGLHNGETLNTGSRAFALIRLNDGTRMTLRPNTTFKIENVDIRQGSENALLSLIRGGFRALTGFISKRTPTAFRINTSVATIGIRGTEFDARLCEGGECQAEEEATGQSAQRESRVVGRVALLRGKASATEDDQNSRALQVGAAVYERDHVHTGIKAFAVIAFNDKTRVTLSPQSAFRIEEHEFKPEQPDENNSFFSFLQGGMRLVTGLIGQLNRKSFRVGTPTATIGIRGTGFDLVCQGACVSNTSLQDPARDTLLGKLLGFFVRPAYAQSNNSGMYAKVWSGSIELQLGNNKTLLLKNGRTAFLRDNFSQPRLVPDIPAKLRTFQGAPRPDKVKVEEGLFSESDMTTMDPGLFVRVDNGDVTLKGADGKTVFVGAGEAAPAGGARAVRLRLVPAFQKFDTTPRPAQITEQSEKMMNLFGERGAGKESMECTVR